MGAYGGYSKELPKLSIDRVYQAKVTRSLTRSQGATCPIPIHLTCRQNAPLELIGKPPIVFRCKVIASVEFELHRSLATKLMAPVTTTKTEGDVIIHLAIIDDGATPIVSAPGTHGGARVLIPAAIGQAF
jgi:hypothetical protein